MLECRKERIDLKHKIINFAGLYMLLAVAAGVGDACAKQAPNPRSAMVVNAPSGRSEQVVVKRGDGRNSAVVTGAPGVSAQRSASVVSRSGGASGKGVARSAVAARSGVPAIMRSATEVKRLGGVSGRSDNVDIGMARAGARARATAVYTDVSKIGGGYAQCRDAYATCMDQFCATANDTYRRCFCSSRFIEYRDAEQAMDEAKLLLQRFEDTSLNAVDKTAAEVDAMYSATVGEAAIKSDTSAAQNILNEIGDLLSGKKKQQAKQPAVTVSLDSLSFDFSEDVGDVWGGTSSFFGSSSVPNLAELEGQDLFNEANKQCVQLAKESCGSSTILNMATSSYGILIAQDCNLYDKRVSQKREQVLQVVRQAEKILREARLEEYRAHNSADVNECLSNVKKAMLKDTACGQDYARCLDYSGAYVNMSTGEPIYSPRLFELTNIITLAGAGGNMDVLGQNPKFNEFLDSKRIFAEGALDTCRSIADTVWTEFKRVALIEIAQAQDEKIESVKMSCVSTMAECYDKQSSALKSFDTTTAQTSGALSAYAARSMCEEKVIACASLYGDTTGCKFDGNGRLTQGNARDGSARCGLTALLAFVDSVDNVRVAEGCESAIESQLEEWCTPADDSEHDYPWQCRLMGAKELSDNIARFALRVCSDPTKPAPTKVSDLPMETTNKIKLAVDDVTSQLDYQLSQICEEVNGYWIDIDMPEYNSNTPLEMAFYKMVYGGNDSYVGFGKCVENTTRTRCLAYNANEMKEDDAEAPQLASYDLKRDECTFVDDWFKTRCTLLGNGYFENGVCYIAAE